MRGRWGFLAAALLLGCGDSGPTPPKTYPVKGRVVYTDGTPMSGGSVAFTLDRDPDLSAIGDIGPNGEFALRTIVGNKRLTGSVAGTFEVTIKPPSGPEKSVNPGETLAEPVEVKPGQQIDLKLVYPSPKPP